MKLAVLCVAVLAAVVTIGEGRPRNGNSNMATLSQLGQRYGINLDNAIREPTNDGITRAIRAMEKKRKAAEQEATVFGIDMGQLMALLKEAKQQQPSQPQQLPFY